MKNLPAFFVLFFLLPFLLRPSAASLENAALNSRIVSEANRLAYTHLHKGEPIETFFSTANVARLTTLVQPLVETLKTQAKEGILNKYGYYAFMPQYITSVMPVEGSTVTYSSPCYAKNVVSNVTVNSDSISFVVTPSNPTSTDECRDFYLFGSLSELQFHHPSSDEQSFVITWPTSTFDSALNWDLETYGIRIMHFAGDPEQMLMSLLQSLLLFEPEIFGPAVNPIFGTLNVDFLRTYPPFPFADRNPLNREININASEIHSGDFIAITRMDGLDPMIIWGMGGVTGHTAVALWFDDGLYITESQVNSAYWPTNNIQRTPYDQWITQARAADYNMAHVPLSQEKRDQFDEDAARNFFFSVEGVPYGYHNFLFGWIDTPNGNFPCLPPDYKICLMEEVGMIFAGIVDRVAPRIAFKFVNQALEQRVGLPLWDNITTAEIFQYAAVEKNIDFGELISMPEQDKWVYTDGPSMVCDVYVCSVWKAAGLFGNISDEIQCTELTPFDVYTLNFFETDQQLPEECKREDPTLPYCQLNGKYTMDLYKYNTVEPYPNYAQNCPGTPPNYTRPDNC